MIQRLLNWVDIALDAMTLGTYGLVEEWPVIDDSDNPTDWSDWRWVE